MKFSLNKKKNIYVFIWRDLLRVANVTIHATQQHQDTLKIWNRCILNNRILDWDRKKHQSDQTYPSQRIPRSWDRIQSFQSHFSGEKLLRYGYIIHTQVSSTITIFRQNKLPIVYLFCNVTSWSRNPGPPTLLKHPTQHKEVWICHWFLLICLIWVGNHRKHVHHVVLIKRLDETCHVIVH